MGVSWRLTRRHPSDDDRSSAERWLAIQLLLNALWSYIFFGRRRIGWGLLDSVALTAAVAITIAKVRRVSQPAAILLVPYLLWVLFATVLNGALWRRNRPVGTP